MVVWEEREVLTGSGGVYSVFTPYSKAWKLRPIPGPRPKLGPAKTPGMGDWISLPLPSTTAELGHPLTQTLFPAGERAARQALDAFVERRVYGYATGRDTPADEGGTSRLSPHLRFGTLGVRTALARLERSRASASTEGERKGCDIWLSELIWREFYIQILANHPHVAAGSFRREYDRLEWEGREEWFEAWCAGRTGYPIVDAAMRCLNATGWMHNRLRMVVSMFLTKDLLVSWQRGERHFMRQLVDGDLAANNGGWQWSAGTGTDAAPYFRIFNPVSQGEKFDPAGRFVRRWVPELEGVDDRRVHRPWEDGLRAARGGYPSPVVDHVVQRGRCLHMYQKVRGSVAAPAAEEAGE
jgi:deoxyribodipyrimidine photo-lyase